MAYYSEKQKKLNNETIKANDIQNCFNCFVPFQLYLTLKR